MVDLWAGSTGCSSVMYRCGAKVGSAQAAPLTASRPTLRERFCSRSRGSMDSPSTSFSPFRPPVILTQKLDTFLRDQALTIVMAVTLTDPEVVVIGGGVIDMDGYPFNSLIQAVHSCLSPVLGKDRIVLTRAALGSAAATWGALSLLTNAEGQMRVEIAERRPTGASAAKIERE